MVTREAYSASPRTSGSYVEYQPRYHHYQPANGGAVVYEVHPTRY
jgi:hypothetical protein